MRIALVSQEYPPETAHGGIAAQTYSKAKGLAALGHDVHVLTRSTTRQRYEREHDGVTVIRLPVTADKSLLVSEPAQWLAWSTDVAAELALLHARLGLDVVDVPEYGGEGYVHLLNRTEWHSVPTVVHLHGPLAMLAATIGWPEPGSEPHRVGRHMESTSLRLADAVISSSRCSARWCASEYDLPVADVPVLHLGVDTELFTPAATPRAARPRIVFTGRIAESKGVEVVVRAACSLRRAWPDLRVDLVGRGTPEVTARLRSIAQAAGAPDLLEFHGHLDHRSLAKVLAAATVFAAPSQYEGGPGFVYLEAMACGLPVVAGNAGGSAEVVEDGETGLLVAPNDVAATASAIERLLGPEGTRMGAEGRLRAVRDHDTSVRVRQMEGLYVEVRSRAVPVRSVL